MTYAPKHSLTPAALACAALAIAPLAFAGAALTWKPAPASAQQAAPASPPAGTPKPVGSFKAWDAYTFEDKGRLMCYTQGEPAGSIGKAASRGKAAVMVIQAPDAAAKDQVSIVLGFAPNSDKPITVTIGPRPGRGKKYTMKKFAVGRAWADNDRLDKQMVDAMKHYDWLVVNLVSDKGEKMQDTYNLSGFGNAYDAAVKACK
jgi:invasion protein IalB